MKTAVLALALVLFSLVGCVSEEKAGTFVTTPASTASPATTATAGTVKLAGNLGGTSALPTVTGLTIASAAAGDVLYYNGTSWVRLPAGTSGQYLQTYGIDAGSPAWAAGGGAPSGAAAGDLSGTYPNPVVWTLTGDAGIVTGPSTALTFGSSPATTGTLRLSNAQSLNARTADGGANMNLAKSDTSDVLTYGGTANMGLVLNTGTGNTISNQVNSVAVGTFSGTGLTVPGNLSVGATPSVNATGVNLPNNVFIWGYNAASSLGYQLLGVDASNSVVVGSASAGGVGFSASTIGVKALGFDLTGLAWTQGQASTAVRIGQGQRTADAVPSDFTVYAQNAFPTATTSAATKSGGGVLVRGGARTSTAGRRGAVRVQLNGSATENMIEACDVQPEATAPSRVLSLLRATAITSTEMPTNTGDLVIYIGNSAVAPSANPVSGGILYVESGALKYRGTSGTVTTLGAP